MTVRITKPEFNLRDKLNYLDFDRVPYQKMPAGSIIQIVTGETDTQFNSSSSSYVNVGLSATISPKFSSSKIYIVVMNTVQQQGNRTRVTLHSSVTNATMHGSSNGLQAYEGNGVNMACNIIALDSPNITSAVTYNMQMMNTGGSLHFAQAATHKGRMVLMEVRQ